MRITRQHFLYPRSPGVSRKGSGFGFTLVELLVVIAIMAIVMTLVVPATKGLLGGTGRKGAVNQLLNTFEQARVAALESGVTVYVLLWRRGFPDSDAYLVMRKGTQSDLVAPATTVPDYVYLTGWKSLPKGIIFYQPPAQNSNILSAPLPADITAKLNQFPLVSKISPAPVATDFGLLEFNESGVIRFPASGTQLALFIGEGVRGAASAQQLTQTVGASGIDPELSLSGGLEKLSFSRFTGRARLEVATFN